MTNEDIERHTELLKEVRRLNSLAEAENVKMFEQLAAYNEIPWWRLFKQGKALKAMDSKAGLYLERADILLNKVRDIEATWQ